MAKLTNVKTLDMENGEITKIQFDGEVYQCISDRAVEGDIWGDSESGGRYIYAPRHVELIAKADEVYA